MRMFSISLLVSYLKFYIFRDLVINRAEIVAISIAWDFEGYCLKNLY